jgi:hypothetical protein
MQELREHFMSIARALYLPGYCILDADGLNAGLLRLSCASLDHGLALRDTCRYGIFVLIGFIFEKCEAGTKWS